MAVSLTIYLSEGGQRGMVATMQQVMTYRGLTEMSFVTILLFVLGQQSHRTPHLTTEDTLLPTKVAQLYGLQSLVIM